MELKVKIQLVLILRLKANHLEKNQYIDRISFDAVSALSGPAQAMNESLYPGWSKHHYVTIPAETSNPVTEHGAPILDRLDPEMIIGNGVNKLGKLLGYIINAEMLGGCACRKMKVVK